MYRHFISATAMAAVMAVAFPVTAQESRQGHRDGQSFFGAMIEPANQGGEQGGLVIRDVTRNSPAHDAGLQKGDIITKVDGKNVRDASDITNAIQQQKAGDTIRVDVKRDGAEKHVNLTMHQPPTAGAQTGREPDRSRLGTSGRNQEQTDRTRPLPGGRIQDQSEQGRLEQGTAQRGRGATGFLGVQTTELTPETRDEQGATANEGVIIMDVIPNSAAAQAGLQRGDIIRHVDGKNINTPDELRTCIRNKAAGDKVKLGIARDNRAQELTARLDGNPEQSAPMNLGRSRLRYSSGYPAEGAVGGAPQSSEIQRLEQRINQLEQRLREMERHNRSGESK